MKALLADPSFWSAVFAAAIAGWQAVRAQQHKSALASVVVGVETALNTTAGQQVEGMVKKTIELQAARDGTSSTVAASVAANT